jgi:hypothetical protein
VKIWIVFLLGAFVIGGHTLLRGARPQAWLLMGVCVVVAFLLSSQRFA